MSLLHLLRHGHWPSWTWCYMGLTIAAATRRGIGGHRFCQGCVSVEGSEWR